MFGLPLMSRVHILYRKDTVHEQQKVTNGRAKESVVHTRKIMFVLFLGAEPSTVYSTIPYNLFLTKKRAEFRVRQNSLSVVNT